MKHACMRSGLLALLVLLAVTAACTNSEQLSSGAGILPIKVSVVNLASRFGKARFDVSQITVRPVDPDASEVLGIDPLGIMRSDDVILVDYNLGNNQFEVGSPITVGVYQVESIALTNLEFTGGQRLGTASCEEYITDFPPVAGPVRLSDFGEPVIVTVTLGADGQLSMVIDGAALVSAFETSWRCNMAPTPCFVGGFTQCPTGWCICPNDENGFLKSMFSDQSSTFLSFP